MDEPVRRDERRRFTPRQARMKYVACDGKCEKCGCELQSDFHMHHIKPHSKGGATYLFNCMALCVECHLEVHRNEIA